MFYDSEKRLWFRQSWLKEFVDCPERARRKAIEKDRPRTTSDAALIGTGVHTAIQGVLEGRVAPEDIQDATNEAVLGLLTTEEVNFAKYEAQDLPGHAARCAKAFVDGILPDVPLGGECEHQFSTIIDEVDGVEIGLTGTVDYIAPDGEQLWDWKTANRKYSQTQYQKGSLQASTYATALSLQKMVELPVEFKFGVMIRGERAASSQIVVVQRQEEHRQWFLKRVRDIARFVIRYGTDEPWATNEESFLCSATWCEFYNTCRGSYISKDADSFNV